MNIKEMTTKELYELRWQITEEINIRKGKENDMKKFRIIGTVENANCLQSKHIDIVVEAESEEEVRKKYEGYTPEFDYWDIEKIVEVK